MPVSHQCGSQMMQIASWMEKKFPVWVLLVQVPVSATLLWYLGVKHLYYRLFPILLIFGAILFWFPVFSKKLSALAPIYYFGLISLLSSTTTTTSRSVMFGVFHPPEYFFLALLCMHAARVLGVPRDWKSIILVLGSGAVLAALDECHQCFVPGRIADPFDWMLDLVGVLAGIIGYWFLSTIGQWENHETSQQRIHHATKSKKSASI